MIDLNVQMPGDSHPVPYTNKLLIHRSYAYNAALSLFLHFITSSHPVITRRDTPTSRARFSLKLCNLSPIK
jgi:hypothetical protein